MTLKDQIADHYKRHDGEVISYVDLMDVFDGADLRDIVDACNELEADGKIGVVDD